jgi:hypothetical protein
MLLYEYITLDYVTSVYIGTETGISLSADENSDMKTNLFDPRPRPWYTDAVEAGFGYVVWSDVFADSLGRGLSITCSTPFYGP